MCTLATYFQEDKNTYCKKKITVFNFIDDKSDEFIQNYIIPFRRAYVSDEDLNYEVDNDINTRQKAIENRLPTKPQLQSGEFGEILLLFLAKDFICPDANIIPVKWQWKENRDVPSHLTDVMLLKCPDDQNPNPKDYIYSIEVKSAATSSKVSKINDAIDGAIKDKDSRIGKMIAYLTTKYVKDRKATMAKLVKRFDDSVNIPYDRKISAAVVVEKAFLRYHIDNITQEHFEKAKSEPIVLFAVPIKELKQLYEKIYSLIPKKG